MSHAETAQFFTAGTVALSTLQAIGEAVLSEHLKTYAALVVYATTPVFRSHKAMHKQFFEQSVAFVQGTGIETVVDAYELDVDPEELKETFFSWCERYKKRLHSALSSVTIRSG